MQIVLDEREVQLIQRFHELVPHIDSITTSRQMLPLGDVLIQHNEKDLFLIERKTLSDLIASIKDGRYEEQSYRFCHSVPIERHHIIYILEGPMSQLRTPQEKKMVYSSIIRMHAFKGFTVFRSSSVLETCDYILSLCDKTLREFQKQLPCGAFKTRMSKSKTIVRLLKRSKKTISPRKTLMRFCYVKYPVSITFLRKPSWKNSDHFIY